MGRWTFATVTFASRAKAKPDSGPWATEGEEAVPAPAAHPGTVN